MSIDAFPIDLPLNSALIEADLEVKRRQAGGVLGSGRDFVVDAGQPQWTASARTRKLFLSEVGSLRAFREKLRGQGRFFRFYDPAHAYPAAYMPAGWSLPSGQFGGVPNRATLGVPFDGFCSLGAIANSLLPGAVGRDLLTIGAPWALPVGLHLIAGDMIEFREGAQLLVNPDDLSNASWTKTNCAAVANNATDPLGTTTADTVTISGAGASSIVETITGLPAGYTFRAVIWLKLGTLTGAINVTLADGSGGNAVTTAFSPTGTWSRFEFTAAMPIGAAANLKLTVAPANAAASGKTWFAWKPRVTQRDLETLSLHRVLDTAQLTADANGSVQIWVEPELPTSFDLDALANLFQAKGKFRLMSFALPVQASGRNRPGQATLTAQSVLL